MNKPHSVEVSKLFLPILAIGFTIITFIKGAVPNTVKVTVEGAVPNTVKATVGGAAYAPAIATVIGLLIFGIIGVLFVRDMLKSQNLYIRQEIAHAILEHRIKQQEKENDSQKSTALDLPQPITFGPDTHLKQDVLDALQEHQARQSSPLQKLFSTLSQSSQS